ncbi:hypothetical protein AB0J57_18920 [Streptomyces sp. NPDC049837]|uniref:hypothetical protein n=1 Tax=Streptomyces sp. NPDC049837 TaxID=3155277 RepID=UPI0034467462
MSTVLIVVALVVVFAAVVAAVLYMGPGRRGLKRRFGPEYERTVARHDGDTKAAERELAERVERHGDLRARPLSREAREQYVALWAGLQEQFVDAPRQAVAEADRLLARLAEDRGFPAASTYEEQVAALSVHHAHHVDGYRRVHRTARADIATATGTAAGTATGTGTEELRAAMVEARRLFEELVADHPEDHARHAPRNRPSGRAHRFHAPWPKGSGA